MRKKDLKYWIAGAILVIIFMAATFPYIIAKSRFESLKAELREQGEPVTFREYVDKYYKPIPDEDNAVGVLNEAFALYKGPDANCSNIIWGDADKTRFDQKTSPLQLPYVKAFMKANRSSLDKLQELKNYDSLRFEINSIELLDVVYENIDKLSDAAKLYALKMELLIYEAKPQEAEKLLKEMFHLAGLAIQTVPVAHITYSYSCENIALDALERSMNTLSFSSEQLKFFQELCEAQELVVVKNYPYDAKRIIYFQLDIASFQGLVSLDFYPYESNEYINRLPLNLRQSFYYYSGSYFNDLSTEIKAFKSIMNVPVDCYAKRKSELEKIDYEYRQTSSPSFGPCYADYLRIMDILSRLRSAATACAVERYRLKYGNLPKDLNALVPEFMDKVPVDPFDGNQLRYFRGVFELECRVAFPDKMKKAKWAAKTSHSGFCLGIYNRGFEYKTVNSKKTGYHVYSVGWNLIDDKSLKFDGQPYPEDIGFLVIDKKQ